jgi:single-strand DNA-binding protein
MQILTIAGNVGKDAVLCQPQGGGDAVLNFSIAVDNGKDKDGQARPATWYDCSIWGKRASSLERYVLKGTKLAVSGRPSARAHEGKAYLGITVSELTFQGGSQQSDGERGDSRPPPSGGAKQSQSGGYSGGLDDDIPFEMAWR